LNRDSSPNYKNGFFR